MSSSFLSQGFSLSQVFHWSGQSDQKRLALGLSLCEGLPFVSIFRMCYEPLCKQCSSYSNDSIAVSMRCIHKDCTLNIVKHFIHFLLVHSVLRVETDRVVALTSYPQASVPWHSLQHRCLIKAGHEPPLRPLLARRQHTMHLNGTATFLGLSGCP